MQLIAKADVVLALGTRLNPFSTLPGYGIDYWPKKASIIQVDMNSDRIGLTKKVTVGICGDAKLVAQQLLTKLSANFLQSSIAFPITTPAPDNITGNFAFDNNFAASVTALEPPDCLSSRTIGGNSISII